MKFISIITVLVITSSIITSCETDATNIRLPEYEPKLVIAGFLSPSDTATYIRVMQNGMLYYDNAHVSLGRESVFISNGESEVQVDTVTFKKTIGSIYKLDYTRMKIEYGKTYSLKITTDKGYKAEASCTVPEKRSFNLDIDTITVYEKNWPKLAVRAAFKDIPGESDYYKISIYAGVRRKEPDTGWSIRPVRIDEPLFTDYKMDGKELVTITLDGINWQMTYDSVYIVARLYHLDESYYRYHKSLDDYEGGDVPFIEPTMVYTNVQGGLGVFTAYAVDSAVLRLK